jgi:hypothetical protein
MIKRLTISSVEEQEERMYYHWLSLTPAQRLASVFDIHMQIFGDIVHAPKLRSNRIVFTKG